MIKFSEELFTKDFIGDSIKDAYLKACKWYASNVMAKDELHGICVEYEKVYDRQSPTITAHLYITMLEEEVRQNHCQICKEIHQSFFMNSTENCNNCNVSGYYRRLNQKISVKREFYKELFRERETL